MVMEKPMTDLALVERELAELASQLKQSFRVLDELGEVQLRFEELSQTHVKFKEFVEKNNNALTDLTQLQKIVDQRFLEIEAVLKTRWDEIRNQLARTHGELSTADRNLSVELMQQLNTLKREVDDRLMLITREWERQRDEMQAPLEEFEARLMTELKAALNRMNQSGFNTTHIEKLDAQVLNTRSSLRTVEKQMKGMRTWLVLTTLLAVLAFGLPVTMLVMQLGRTTTAQPDTRP
jgi:DNA repair exonuclease SbcCD ATPase subunit